MAKEHQLSVKVDDELWEMIEDEMNAHPYNVKKSDIVRTALREYLQGNVKRSRRATASN